MIVVEFFGGPGSGKTTTASSCWSLLKQQGIPCEFVREYAQELIYRGSTGTLQSQFVVSAGQFGKYVEHLSSGTKLLFADSSALLASVYGDETTITRLQCYIAALYRMGFDGRMGFIKVFVRRKKAFQSQGRIHTEDESITLDSKVREVCGPFDIEVDGTVEGLYELLRELPRLLVERGYPIHEYPSLPGPIQSLQDTNKRLLHLEE